MSHHFVQGLKLAAALVTPVVTTLFFRARTLATARATARAHNAATRALGPLERDA